MKLYLAGALFNEAEIAQRRAEIEQRRAELEDKKQELLNRLNK